MSNSWIAGVKYILDMCGFSNIWYEQNIVNVKWISTIVKVTRPIYPKMV